MNATVQIIMRRVTTTLDLRILLFVYSIQSLAGGRRIFLAPAGWKGVGKWRNYLPPW
jgi:hypothetical protein